MRITTAKPPEVFPDLPFKHETQNGGGGCVVRCEAARLQTLDQRYLWKTSNLLSVRPWKPGTASLLPPHRRMQQTNKQGSCGFCFTAEFNTSIHRLHPGWGVGVVGGYRWGAQGEQFPLTLCLLHLQSQLCSPSRQPFFLFP